MICCAITISIIIVILIVLIAFLAPVVLTIFGVIAIARVITGKGETMNNIISRDAALALEYPYCNLYMNESQVENAFKAVQEYKLNLVTNVKYKINNMPELAPEQLMFHYNPQETRAYTLIVLSPDDYK